MYCLPLVYIIDFSSLINDSTVNLSLKFLVRYSMYEVPILLDQDYEHNRYEDQDGQIQYRYHDMDDVSDSDCDQELGDSTNKKHTVSH